MSQFADFEATRITDALYSDPQGGIDMLRFDLNRVQSPGEAAELVGKVKAWQTSDAAGTLVIGPPQWDTCGGPGTANVAVQYTDGNNKPVLEIVAPLELRPRDCDAAGNLLPLGGPALADGAPGLVQPDAPPAYADPSLTDYGNSYDYGADYGYGYNPLAMVSGLYIMGPTGYGVSRWGDNSWSNRQEGLATQYRQAYQSEQPTGQSINSSTRIVSPIASTTSTKSEVPTTNTTVNNRTSISNIYNVTNNYGTAEQHTKPARPSTPIETAPKPTAVKPAEVSPPIATPKLPSKPIEAAPPVVAAPSKTFSPVPPAELNHAPRPSVAPKLEPLPSTGVKTPAAPFIPTESHPLPARTATPARVEAAPATHPVAPTEAVRPHYTNGQPTDTRIPAAPVKPVEQQHVPVVVPRVAAPVAPKTEVPRVAAPVAAPRVETHPAVVTPRVEVARPAPPPPAPRVEARPAAPRPQPHVEAAPPPPRKR